MNRSFISSLLLSLFTLLFIFFTGCASPEEEPQNPPRISGAGQAMDAWFAPRAYPHRHISMQPYSTAYASFIDAKDATQKVQMNEWEPLGPWNVGGRTLCLAFNPLNSNSIWVGSAAGGLWRSYYGGLGADAWEYVPTGFPVLGVGAIAFHPADSNVMYIGTGEVYNYQETGNRVAVRTTRGSYGIGILKSTDGGATWSKSLDWAYDELKGVQDLQVDPSAPNTVWAATSEGTYKTTDGGANWNLVHPGLMASEVYLHPTDPDTVFLSVGNLNTPGGGLFRSYDGGANFVQLTNGLPNSFTGKTLLDGTRPPSNFALFASVADSLSGLGLYKSTNMGNTWTQINNEDYPKYQGWFSHDVAINPQNPNQLFCVGVDAWLSTDGGTTLNQVSDWRSWYIYATPPVGGPGGDPDWVHADIHRAYWHPTQANTAFFVTDGGIFRTTNGGQTFEDLNGSYQTTQFYANFANSQQDSNLAIGGLQDNGTVIYKGNKAWYRVIGGDGVSCAVDPNFDQSLYAGYQYGNILFSSDQGISWVGLLQGSSVNTVNFVAPYELCESNPGRMYAGEDVFFISTDAGYSWAVGNGGQSLSGTALLKIEVAPDNDQLVYASTTPDGPVRAKLFKSTNGGMAFQEVTGSLPDRYYMDIEIDPTNAQIVYVALQGFGTAHVFKSIDGAATWTAMDSGLPDVPTNTLTIDPLNPDNLYVGNDLGVYVSQDGGNSWTPFSDALPDAVMALDLSISPANRKLRVATHGNGAYEADLLGPNVARENRDQASLSWQVYPNPIRDQATVSFQLHRAGRVTLEMVDLQGKTVLQMLSGKSFPAGKHDLNLAAAEYPAGYYLLKLNWEGQQQVKKVWIE